jgi:heat shock protein HslJ
MLRTLLATLVVAALMPACDETPTAPSDVLSRTWQLISLQQDGSDSVVVPDPSSYTLRLGDDGRISVKSDCNSCGGSYTLNASSSSIQIGRLACTLVACRPGSLDPRFAQALEGSKTIAVDGSQLTLRGGGVTLRFQAE